MNAIDFLNLTAATLAGANRRAVRIGTLTQAESARAHAPATYAGRLDDRGVFAQQLDYWHDGECFRNNEDEPLSPGHFVNPQQWQDLRGFEAARFGTFNRGDGLTIDEVFNLDCANTGALAPFWHTDERDAPGQRMYMVSSRIKDLNVEYPAGDMRLQDLAPATRRHADALHERGAMTKCDKFLTRTLTRSGTARNEANAVAVMPLDGIHRSSLLRPQFPGEPWYFGRMGVVRAAP